MNTGDRRILGITLARGGSKRVPSKNIRPLAGAPLIAHTIREAQKSKYLTDYIVSTDDEQIRSVSQGLGATVPFLRPQNLSSDVATSVSALQHAVKWMEKTHSCRYEFIVEVMATNPLKTAHDIDSCIEVLIESHADSAIAVHEVGDAHPARVKRLEDGLIRDFCVPEPIEARRQDLLPKAYIRSGSVYAVTREELMVHGRRYGSDNSRAYLLPESRALNIDSERDFMLAEVIIASHEEGAGR